MRIVLALVVLCAAGMAQSLPDTMVRHFCGGAPLATGTEFDLIAAIAKRLKVNDPRIQIALVQSSVINAWEVEPYANLSLICLPVAMVSFMSTSEGELAFVVAHEISHATDEQCKSHRDRARLSSQSPRGTLLAIVFGRSDGTEPGDQRSCETRADEFGLKSMMHAGYDPEGAVTALRKISAYSGDADGGPIAKLAAFVKDHPTTPDRIRRIHKLIARSNKHPLP
jgi:Zn-dependent protease with chaperone function